MQQQQINTKTTTVTTEKSADKAVTNETFDAMRTAALSMFQQRTKDLTKVSLLQEQTQMLEQEVEAIQSTLSQLHRSCAKLDAKREGEEQRVRERESRVQEVHGALFHLDEDIKTYSRINGTSVLMVGAVHQFVQNHLHTESRFQQLLEKGKELIGDRTAADFRGIAADLRRRNSLLNTYLQSMASTGVLHEEAMVSLRKWCTGHWEQCPELASVVQDCRDILQHQTSSERVLQPVETEETHWEKEAFFQLNSTPISEGESGASIPQEISRLKAEFLSVLQTYQQELDQISQTQESIQARSKELGVACTVGDNAPLQALRQAWLSLTADYDQWGEARLASDHSEKEKVSLLEQEAVLEAQLHKAQEKLAAIEKESSDMDRSESLLDEEKANYTTATSKAFSTLHRLHQSIHEVSHTLVRSDSEIKALHDAIQAKEAELEAQTKEHEERLAALALETAQVDQTILTTQVTADALQGTLAKADAIRSRLQTLQVDVSSLEKEKDGATDLEAYAAALASLREEGATFMEGGVEKANFLLAGMKVPSVGDLLAMDTVSLALKSSSNPSEIQPAEVQGAFHSLGLDFSLVSPSCEGELKELCEVLREYSKEEKSHQLFLEEAKRGIESS